MSYEIAMGLCLVCLFGAAVMAIWHINYASTNVAYADTWSYVRMIGDFLSGDLRISEVLAAHNENRTVILSAVLLASAKFDHLNLIHLDYLSVVSAAATVLALLLYSRPLFEHRPYAMCGSFLCVSALVCSLGQWENLLLPIDFVFYSAITFSTLAVILMHGHLVASVSGRLSGRFIFAIICSELAVFSMSGGLVVWGSQWNPVYPILARASAP